MDASTAVRATRAVFTSFDLPSLSRERGGEEDSTERDEETARGARILAAWCVADTATETTVALLAVEVCLKDGSEKESEKMGDVICELW